MVWDQTHLQDYLDRVHSWQIRVPNPTTNPNFRQLEMAKEILYRSSTIERKDNIDEEARTIELSFSSEASVERVFGNEVLEHSSDAVVGPSGRRRHR